MTAQILPFSRAKSDTTARGVEARNASEADIRSFITELRADLEAPAGKRKKLWRLQDVEHAIVLAKRLGADLERIKRSGHGKLSRVLAEGNVENTSRKRYALFDDELPNEKPTLKLQSYVRLTDAISRELKRDADLFLYEKLVDLDLAKPARTLGLDKEAQQLGRQLEKMASAVAAKKDLTGFFDLAAQTPGTIDEWGRIHSYTKWTCFPLSLLPDRPEELRPTTMTVLRDRRHEGGFDYWTEQQPLPSVPICRILEQTLQGRARIANWESISSDVKMCSDALESLSREVDAKSTGDCVSLTVEIWREIGLSLGERYQKGEIGPMFSGKAHIKVNVGGVDATPFYPWTLEQFFWEQPAVLVHEDRWTACRAQFDIGEDFSDCWIEPLPLPGKQNYAVEHYYFSQHPVSANNLRRLLDRHEHDDQRAESLLPRNQRLQLYRFSGEIGRRFEEALSSGALEDALGADIDRLKGELDRYLTERREQLAAQDNALDARWRLAGQPETDSTDRT